MTVETEVVENGWTEEEQIVEGGEVDTLLSATVKTSMWKNIYMQH